MPELHPDLRHVSTLVGTWTGTGRGTYPTIEPFDYAESVTFGHVGKPFLAYQQRTRSLGAGGRPGQPMHAESGYWRFPTTGRVEAVLSHPTGVAEIDEGTIEVAIDGALIMHLTSTHVALSATAKTVTSIERMLRVHGDTLTYRVGMAAVGLPLQVHLTGTLVREYPD
ncbi:MAG TPA: FABP family protein [Ilumatobacter sp.]